MWWELFNEDYLIKLFNKTHLTKYPKEGSTTDIFRSTF